ncbi:Flp family type IVb pilin [Fulvimarina sp. MAC8]|uniref:Flp family type IVb pilin n=1 Tax=Fulvimarina sp. MAC8 TaxID=3162874 RepID=UPI0032EB0054
MSSLVEDQSGATAIEYVLIAGIIAVGLVSSLALLDLPTAFANISTAVANAIAGG